MTATAAETKQNGINRWNERKREREKSSVHEYAAQILHTHQASNQTNSCIHSNMYNVIHLMWVNTRWKYTAKEEKTKKSHVKSKGKKAQFLRMNTYSTLSAQKIKTGKDFFVNCWRCCYCCSLDFSRSLSRALCFSRFWRSLDRLLASSTAFKCVCVCVCLSVPR